MTQMQAAAIDLAVTKVEITNCLLFANLSSLWRVLRSASQGEPPQEQLESFWRNFLSGKLIFRQRRDTEPILGGQGATEVASGILKRWTRATGFVVFSDW